MVECITPSQRLVNSRLQPTAGAARTAACVRRRHPPRRRCCWGRRAGGPAAPTGSLSRPWAGGPGVLRQRAGGRAGQAGRGWHSWYVPGRRCQTPPSAALRCAARVPRHSPRRTPRHPPLSACPVFTKLGPRPDSTVRSCRARSGALLSMLPDARSASTRVMNPPRDAATCTERAASSADRTARQAGAGKGWSGPASPGRAPGTHFNKDLFCLMARRPPRGEDLYRLTGRNTHTCGPAGERCRQPLGVIVYPHIHQQLRQVRSQRAELHGVHPGGRAGGAAAASEAARRRRGRAAATAAPPTQRSGPSRSSFWPTRMSIRPHTRSSGRSP